MWQLGLGSTEEEEEEEATDVAAPGGAPLPERPGEPDCVYYLRTGSCGYGDRCRFHHPLDRTQAAVAARAGGEFPERIGQPVCQYFMRTGNCKFGATCKYHHPNQAGSVHRQAQLNYHGYPLRPGEKECAYYVKTGSCKFGVTCKFHHPQPVVGMPPAPAAVPMPTFYPPVQTAAAPPSQPYAAMAGWPHSRPPAYLPGSYPYAPIAVPPSVIPMPSWSPYPPHVSTVVSSGALQTVQAGAMYGGAPHPLSALAQAYPALYPSAPSPSRHSSNSQREHNFPERPGQPECQFYMRTGDCKYGPSCRYHHPPEWSMPKTSCALSPLGLPLRPDQVLSSQGRRLQRTLGRVGSSRVTTTFCTPFVSVLGAPPCTFYTQNGVCKFGPTCKFDHPVGSLSYSPSASSLADMPVAPYPIGFSVAALAPSSSSSDLQHEYFGAAPGDSVPVRVPPSGSRSSGSIGSMFSSGYPVTQSIVRAPIQNSIPSSSSSSAHGIEITNSNESIR